MEQQHDFPSPSTSCTFIALEQIRVATPCSADWDRMQGDDRVRFCQSCEKNVYNLSALSRADAESLITAKEGKLCVQYFQRADGTIITDDCPVPVAVTRRSLMWMVVTFAALLASGAAMAAGGKSGKFSQKVASLCMLVSGHVNGFEAASVSHPNPVQYELPGQSVRRVIGGPSFIPSRPLTQVGSPPVSAPTAVSAPTWTAKVCDTEPDSWPPPDTWPRVNPLPVDEPADEAVDETGNVSTAETPGTPDADPVPPSQ